MADRLIELFADVLDLEPATLSDATSQATTPAWDSLAGINLTVAIEQAFALKLTTREVVTMTSIGAARDVLRKRGVTGI